MTTTAPSLTNEAFADAVGCHFTMASRLRNGRRLPGIRLLIRISDAYDIEYDELMDAYREGPEAFGELLRSRVFDVAPAA